MDDLLREFLTETAENLDVVDLELVKLERDPNNKEVLDRIFRLVHTVKGTCGFLGLSRLERVAHVSETLLGKFRDGVLTVTPDAVTLILQSLDRIKMILAELEAREVEPQGDDSALIDQLDRAAKGDFGGAEPVVQEAPAAPTMAAQPEQTLGRALKPGEVDLDALEAAFRDAPGPNDSQPAEIATPKPVEAPSAAAALGDSSKAEPSVANQSIRVNVDVLEDLMTMVSELVLTRNQLLDMVRKLDNSEFKVPLQRLSNVTAELQEGVMKTRMQPIGNAWQKLPRIVRDLARELGKKIDLQMVGADTELDRQVLELIKDPLTHMVRNSADHGLETPAERRAANKNETGTIQLKAYHEGGHIIVHIKDDGRGLNTARIKAKALERGLASEAELEKMSESQIHKFIFHAGFSTAQNVTNVSGRGVGMDVVRNNIELIGGAVDLTSKEGMGSTFAIKIPLTLAIVPALIVSAGKQRFAIPQTAVVELVRAKPGSDHRVETINATPVFRLRDQLLPLIYLTDALQVAREDDTPREDAYVIVLRVADTLFGIVVDAVFDTQEIVVKPTATLLRDIPMFSGNTILGDGSVIMIIDPNGVSRSITRDAASEERTKEASAKTIARRNDEVTSLLVFRAGSEEPKAVPLSLVTRLEELPCESIEHANGRTLVQYRGKLMPLVTVSPLQSIKTEGRQPALVFTDGDRAMGLAVDAIVDIVDEAMRIEMQADMPGMVGTAVVRGKATEILDVGFFLTQAYQNWFQHQEASAEERAARRVLLVDDSAFFRNMITPLLQVAGYDVVASDGAEAAFRLKEEGHNFDCIISDIEMPGTDGYAFAKAVKNDEMWRGVPLVALTSRTSPEDQERGRNAGFDAYVGKFDRDRLLAVLQESVTQKGMAA